MNGTKYLSEAICEDDFRSNHLNIIYSPTGCGKTFWAMNFLAKKASHPDKMLYLIDTINGKDQLVKRYPQARLYDKDWFADNMRDTICFDRT